MTSPARPVDASLLLSPRVGVIGDSKSFNYGGGWFKIAVQRCAKLTWGGYYATQGYTLAQIEAYMLPQVLALTGWAKWSACAIDGFTNDTSNTPYSITGSKATLLRICNALVANGILPMLVCVPPRGDGAAHATDIPIWNAWIRALGGRMRWPVLDVHAAVANATSSTTYLSGLSADQIHPNGQGNRVIGTAIAATLSALFPAASGFNLTRTIGDNANLLVSAAQLFVGTPVTNGVAGNWGGSGTGCVFSVDNSDTSIAGAWQHMARPSAGTANAFMHASPRVTVGFTAGDRVAFSCLYKSTGYETNINQDGNIAINFLNASLATIGSMQPISALASDCSVNALAYDEAIVPAGTTAIDVTFLTGGAATTTNGADFQVAEPFLCNLTTLGLA
jgi:hypothetical protein